MIDKDRLTYAKVGYAAGTVSAYAPTGSNAFPTQNVGIGGGWLQILKKNTEATS